MLGRDNVSHVPLDQIGSEFRLEQLNGKLANIAAEMNRLDKVEEGVLKGLVTGDPLQVNRKFKAPITMRPTTKFIFGTNSLPPFVDRSIGIWRRLIPMPLYAQFTGEVCDLQRTNRVLNELSGVFNWALEGARRLRQQGHFTECEVCGACLAEHRFHSDPIWQFVAECATIGPNCSVVKRDLYDAYRHWCSDNGRQYVSSSEFGKQLVNSFKGVKAGKEGSGRRTNIYVGIELRRR